MMYKIRIGTNSKSTARTFIVVQAYLFMQACSFLELFCHNFAENGPQDLKMVQKDASRNSKQSVIKISS
jgi:hypothetical protein